MIQKAAVIAAAGVVVAVSVAWSSVSLRRSRLEQAVPIPPAGFPFPADHDDTGWTGPTGDDRPLLERTGPPYPALRFMTVSDVHHLSSSLVEGGEAFARFLETNDGKVLERSEELLDALVQAVLSERPEFLVVTGDLTSNGGLASHRDVAAHLAEIEANGIRVFVAPGNHDISNPWAVRFVGDYTERVASVDAEAFVHLYREYGYDEAQVRDGSTLAYEVEVYPGLRIIVLDTNIYDTNEARGIPNAAGVVGRRQMEWLERRLDTAAREGAAVLLFGHHSVISHTNSGRGMTHVIEDWPELTRTMWDGGAPLVFTGHIHAQDVAALRGNGGEWIYDVATGALSIYPHAYRLGTVTTDGRFKIEGGRLTQDHFLPQDSCHCVDIGGGPVETASDADIQDDSPPFLEWSARVYVESFADRFAARLLDNELTSRLTRAEARAVAGYAAVVSMPHFAGEETNEEDWANPEARDLWVSVAPDQHAAYVQRMTRDRPPFDNDIEVNLTTGQWRTLRR